MVNFRAGLFIRDMEGVLLIALHMEAYPLSLMFYKNLEQLQLNGMHSFEFKFRILKVYLKIIYHPAKIEKMPGIPRNPGPCCTLYLLRRMSLPSLMQPGIRHSYIIASSLISF